jgi:HK97 family phage prohead protease
MPNQLDLTPEEQAVLAGGALDQSLSVDRVRAIKEGGSPQFRIRASEPYMESGRVVRFVASDETPDRVGDVIEVAGWNLTSYKRNPVVLWGHDSNNTPPIGRAVNVRRGMGPSGKPALLASIEFAPKEAHPFAETLYQLTKGGFLNAVSVGFMPRSTKQISDAERQSLGMPKYGMYYDSADLLEISVVSVPANPSALITGAKSLVHSGVLNQSEVDHFLKTTPMTDDDLSARLKSKIRGFVDLGALASTSKAAPDALKVGDKVRWNSSGGRAQGEIERIVRDGQIKVPDSDFTVEGTAEDPAALIRVFREGEATDTMVGHKFSALSKIASYMDDEEDKMGHDDEDEEKKMGHPDEEEEDKMGHDDEEEDKMGHDDEEEEDKKKRLPAGVLPKHIHSVEETEDAYVITFGKAEVSMMADDDEMGMDDDTMASVYGRSLPALEHLIAAQADQAKALTQLIDSMSDLTKQIHTMNEKSGEVRKPSDVGRSDVPGEDERREKALQVERLTADFLSRLHTQLR